MVQRNTIDCLTTKVLYAVVEYVGKHDDSCRAEPAKIQLQDSTSHQTREKLLLDTTCVTGTVSDAAINPPNHSDDISIINLLFHASPVPRMRLRDDVLSMPCEGRVHCTASDPIESRDTGQED